MDSLFGLDTAHKGENEELLTTVHDDVELSILSDILTTENIPFRTRDRGAGGSMRIITGYSMYGTDLFVPVSELERAREILDAYRNGEPVEEDETDMEDEEDAEESEE